MSIMVLASADWKGSHFHLILRKSGQEILKFPAKIDLLEGMMSYTQYMCVCIFQNVTGKLKKQTMAYKIREFGVHRNVSRSLGKGD